MPPTSHASPWTLLRPDGLVRRAPCMAYLTVTLIDHDGEAYALQGYTMHPSMEGEWSKRARIEWSDIAARWPSQPTSGAVRQRIARLPRQPRGGQAMASDVMPELAVSQTDIAALRAELERLRRRQRENTLTVVLVF